MTGAKEAVAALIEIVATLRSDRGCPWDKEQTVKSLRQYLLEETYEVLDALDSGEPALIQDELGDLLFQIVFLARLFEEQQLFTIAEVTQGITSKLVRRHPHVFADSEARTPLEVMRAWDEIKKKEKPVESDQTRSVLDGVPGSLPALLRANLLSQKAATLGFDWDDAGQVLEKVEEEIGEFKAALCAGRAEDVAAELGDTLFSLVNLGRKIGINPEVALNATNRKFTRRFRYVEAALQEAGPDASKDLEQLWELAKRNIP